MTDADRKAWIRTIVGLWGIAAIVGMSYTVGYALDWLGWMRCVGISGGCSLLERVVVRGGVGFMSGLAVMGSLVLLWRVALTIGTAVMPEADDG